MSSTLLVQSVYGARERHPRHAHGYTSVSVVLAGSLVERVGRAEASAGPLSVVVKPAGTEHADEFGPDGAVLLRLHVPPRWLGSLEDGTDVAGRWRWLRTPPAARWLLRLAVVSPDPTSAAHDAVAECLGALGEDIEASTDQAASAPPWLLRVRDRIRDERGRLTGVDTLAREAGVHPVYLTRRFRRAFGCSVVACRQAERVRAAAHAMAARDTSLSEVAYEAGFADQSHLTRSFRRMVGVTPSVYRRLVGVGIVQDTPRARR